MKSRAPFTVRFTGAILLAVISGCGGEPAGEGLFTDATRELGIDFKMVNGATGERFINETMVGGAGWIDYDGDGWLDLYLTSGHEAPKDAEKPGTAKNRLYRNLGGGG